MGELKKSLLIITQWLEARKIPYMVFGGVAVSFYGLPRQTFDIDIKISMKSDSEIPHFIEDLKTVAVIIPDQPESFIKDTRVLPVEIHGVRIDIVFADLPFEREAIRRAIAETVYGVEVRLCLPEDLILHKAISRRQKDWLDIENIVGIQMKRLDWPYLLKHCQELSELLSQPDLLVRIKGMKDAGSV